MEQLKDLIKKVCNKEVIFYAIFGVLTTLVNIGSFYVMTSIFNFEENIANIIAISLSVIFAYFTNRSLVFHSNSPRKQIYIILFKNLLFFKSKKLTNKKV